jgi:hypothetical protein
MGYRVKYLGRDVPAHDFDGWAARLRLLRDGEYVQFFRAVAPATALLGLEPRPNQDWWTEFVGEAAAQIEALVAQGFEPTTPAVAIVLQPDVAAVQQRARTPNPSRRHIAATDPGLDGVDVLRFGEGEEHPERRTAPRA